MNQRRRRLRTSLDTRKKKRKREKENDNNPPKKRRRIKKRPKKKIKKKVKKKNKGGSDVQIKLENYGFKYNCKRRKNPNFCDIKTTNKRFDMIYADPPWWYQNNTKSRARQMKADHKYPTMKPGELRDFGKYIKRISSKNCILLMWVTASKMAEACKLCEAWGFEFVTIFKNWLKTNSRGSGQHSKRGGGTYSMICSEYIFLSTHGTPIKTKYIPAQFLIGDFYLIDNMNYLMIGKKGSIRKFKSENPQHYYPNNVQKHFTVSNNIEELEYLVEELSIDDIIDYHKREIEFLSYIKKNHEKNGVGKQMKIERCWELEDRRRHSQKPNMFYERIEKVFPKAKRKIEIFARNTRQGWKCYGNEKEIF